MARFEVRVLPSVAKDLRGVPKPDVVRIQARIAALMDDPRPPQAAKVSGQDLYRIRTGRCRILYEIHDRHLVVVVVKVAHRREVYRDL